MNIPQLPERGAMVFTAVVEAIRVFEINAGHKPEGVELCTEDFDEMMAVLLDKQKKGSPVFRLAHLKAAVISGKFVFDTVEIRRGRSAYSTVPR